MNESCFLKKTKYRISFFTDNKKENYLDFIVHICNNFVSHIIMKRYGDFDKKAYADKIDSWIGKGNIIVLVGPHRVGKSSILKDFIQRHSQEKDIHVIYVDKEKKAFKNIKTKDDLDNYIESHYQCSHIASHDCLIFIFNA